MHIIEMQDEERVQRSESGGLYRIAFTSLWLFALGLVAILCAGSIMMKAGVTADRSSAVSFIVVINGREHELLQHPRTIKELENELATRMLNFSSEKYTYTYMDTDGRTIEIRSDEEFQSFTSYYKNPIFDKVRIYVEECCKAFTPWKTRVLEVYDYDVVVIGSGAAGLTAAISANKANPNISVLIIEKEGQLGGDSIKASSGMSACDTTAQKMLGIEDNFQKFYKDTVKSGQGLSNETLVSILANRSRDAWDFLTCLGIDLTAVSQCGGHNTARTHRPKKTPVGFAIVSGLSKYIKMQKSDIIKNITRCDVKELIYDETQNRVSGVVVSHEGKNIRLRAGAVVLATGGFGHDYNNDSLLREYVPHLEHLPTTTGKQAVGDGVKMARRIGVDLIHMNQVQVHPTGFVDPNNPNARSKFLAPELLRGAGGIMINETGDRFCNELGYRDYVSSQIIKCCRPRGEYPQSISVILLNQRCVDLFGPTLKFYIDKGLMRRFDSLDSVAKAFDVSLEGMRRAIQKYNEAAKRGVDQFGKTVFPATFHEPDVFYAGQITPVVHYTMGGVRIDTSAAVLRTSNKVTQRVKGLFAAGEVTGGVHGKNRLVGNSILECIVFGRIAGESAAAHASTRPHPAIN